jgi:competence protein ComEC
MKTIWNYIPLYLLLLYALGILTQFYFCIFTDFVQGFFVLLIFFISCRLFFKKAELLVFYFLGMHAVYVFQNPKGHFGKNENKTSEIHLKIQDFLKANKYTKSYVAEVCFVDSISCTGKVLLRIAQESSAHPLEIGDCVIAHARFGELQKKRNPHDFDYGAYLKRKNIQAQVFLKRNSYRIRKSSSFNLRKWAADQRLFLKRELRGIIKNKEVLGITEAMLLGDKSEVPKEVITNYASAGVLHILAISGLHVGILFALLNFMTRPLLFLKKGKYIRWVFVMLFMWGFALLVGLASSVVRAVAMFSFVGIALCISGRFTVLHSLVSAAFVSLLFNPFFLFDVGFQLSYSAVLFLVVLQPFLARLWRPKYKVLVYFWNLITVSIAAQIGVLPLSLFYFHQFPSLFVLSNLVILPFVGLVLFWALLVLLFALSGWVLPFFVKRFTDFVLLLNEFVDWVAMQEAYIFENVYFPSGYVWTSYVCIILGIVSLKKKKKGVLFVFSCALVFFLLLHLWHNKENREKDVFVVFHKYKSSLLLKKSKAVIEVYTDSRSRDSLYLKAYFRENFPIQKVAFREFENFHKFQNKTIAVLDSVWKNTGDALKVQILILTNSPKLNLERLLRDSEVEQVVADGSNYPSYKERWRKTCQKWDVNYHDTTEKGAFIMSKKN